MDGANLGTRTHFDFSNIRANHHITVAFTCTIKASAGYGGTITRDGDVPVRYGADQSFRITPLPGYTISAVKVDGKRVATEPVYTFAHVTESHTIEAAFKSDHPVTAGELPAASSLLFSATEDTLPAAGNAREWAAAIPAGASFGAIGMPPIVAIDGHRFVHLLFEQGNGFTGGHYNNPIPCSGATIVAIARPVRNGYSSAWTSIVDLFYDRLVLGIKNDTGQVCIRINGSTDISQGAIPDGQTTILSLTVQPDGACTVYANGTEMLSLPARAPFTSIVPGVAGPYAHSITLGRNAPDGWTAFNGDLNGVYLYNRALTQQERKALEAWLANKLVQQKAEQPASK